MMETVVVDGYREVMIDGHRFFGSGDIITVEADGATFLYYFVRGVVSPSESLLMIPTTEEEADSNGGRWTILARL